MFEWFEKRQRSTLLRTPFPEAWREHLAAHAPFYGRLSPEARARLEDLTRIFVAEKTFIGAGGLEITDEIKVVIAASAVRLVLCTHIDAFDKLEEIVVYPSAFLRPEKDDVFLGEAHAWGVVVLSWESVRAGLRSQRDGRDVTLHEMAHVLDRADGTFDGTPELSAGEDYRPWAKVMSQHFLRLRQGRAPENRVLDGYGATNEAEFFAVATEAFFERPSDLKERLPALYDELAKFYGGPS
jgi:Mlc titration factor MtfA (ptsG expression regulator)